MRILVTGSNGVIGQNLMPRLVSEGHKVKGFDLRIDPSMDIRSQQAVFDAFDSFKPDVCIHMAAQVGRLNGENDPHLSVESNITGTLNIVMACLSHDVRLINFSTSEVYGHNSVFGQPDILEQNGMYGLSKLAAEGVVKHYCDTKGLRAVSIRPFMVYGPHETPNGEFRSAISNFISTAMDGGTITAHEGCVRSWCFVDDFIDGLLIVLATEFDGYEAFSIGTEEYKSMQFAADAVCRIVGAGRYEVKPVPKFYVSAVKKADFSRMKELGFTPKVSLEDGIRRTYEWMRGNHV